MKRVKRCVVCGKDHRANARHGNENVKESIDNLQSKNAQTLLSVEDLASELKITHCEDDNVTVDMAKWLVDDEQGDDAEIM